MEFNLEFRVYSISPLPPEGFSLNFGQMLISVMTQVYSLKVTVKVIGFTIEFHISSISPLSFISRRIFIKLWSNIKLSEMVCGEMVYPDLRSQLKVVGFTLEFRVHSISPFIFEMIFIQVHLSEMVCRTHDSGTQTQGQGHN